MECFESRGLVVSAMGFNEERDRKSIGAPEILGKHEMEVMENNLFPSKFIHLSKQKDLYVHKLCL